MHSCMGNRKSSFIYSSMKQSRPKKRISFDTGLSTCKKCCHFHSWPSVGYYRNLALIHSGPIPHRFPTYWITFFCCPNSQGVSTFPRKKTCGQKYKFDSVYIEKSGVNRISSTLRSDRLSDFSMNRLGVRSWQLIERLISYWSEWKKFCSRSEALEKLRKWT